MGCFSSYCEKCGLEFKNFDIDLLKEIYGENIPRELQKIQQLKIMENAIFIRKNIKYYINGYDSCGGFKIIKSENLFTSTLKNYISNQKIYPSDYSDEYTLTHEKCPEIFVKNFQIASRLQGQYMDTETYLRIVFPVSLSERDEKVNELLLVYNPVYKRLVMKSQRFLSKEKNCPRECIINPASNRFVSKTSKIGKEIIEKSEKISDLIQISKDVDTKLIDSGAYGCVIMPPIYQETDMIIIPYTNMKENDISKVFKKEKAFYKELELIQKIQILDPDSIFTTKFKGANFINNENIKQHVIDCLSAKDPSVTYPTYGQIILENGGVRVDRYDSLSYKDFLHKFKVFIEGMIKIQMNGLVHQDIKPGNVLISDQKISLIDFGLMASENRVFVKDNYKLLNYMNYPYYPPEFFMASIMLSCSSRNFVKKLKKLPSIMKSKKFFDQGFLVRNPLLREKYITGIKSFIDEILNRSITSNSELFNAEMARKADVFSTAYVISALNKVIKYTNQDQKDFVDHIYKKCIEINPYSRISFRELYDLLQKEIEKTGNDRSIMRGGTLIKTGCDKVPRHLLKYKGKCRGKTS
jgi:serine/threonine protein kinase